MDDETLERERDENFRERKMRWCYNNRLTVNRIV
jgi:hypothetical protein